MEGKINNKVDKRFMTKIVSFDIWDTLIKRKCHPEEVKLNTMKYMLLKYYKDIKD